MEANYSTQLKVGLFALVGIIVLSGSILLLGGGKLLFHSTYSLRVHFDQVQGLSKGSVVSLTGLPIGNIRQISFLPHQGLLEVHISINEEFKDRITEGSSASIKTQGALGDKYIYITPGPIEASPLKENDLLQTGETADFIEQIATESEKLSEVGDVIEELNIFLKNLNHDNNSRKLVRNLSEGSLALERFMMKAEKETLPRLNSILRKIDEGEGSLGELINDPTLHRKIKSFLGESKRNRFLSPLIHDTQ